MGEFIGGLITGIDASVAIILIILSASSHVYVDIGKNGQPDTVRYKGVVYVLVKADIKETDDHSVPKDRVQR